MAQTVPRDTVIQAPANESAGAAMHALIARLYPLCRSITGSGLRQTLSTLQSYVPMTITEVLTGTPVFDWTIPREWNICDAYVKNARGERVIDFRRHNLHVVNYSVPVHTRCSLHELRPHLFSIPEHPEWIPYRTSYYNETWGFCLAHEQLIRLEPGEYEVRIESSLHDGTLTYGECYLPGETADEVLISAHACHPSLCNDNLSGIAVAVFLAQALQNRKRRYSYRFLFAPGTIGSIAWLAQHREHASHVAHGLVLTCLGDQGGFHYKKSRRGDVEVDRAAAAVLRHQSEPFEVLEFEPYGYDERQFCSPGFNLPVGCLMRSMWGQFPEYHTSADDLNLVRPAALARSLDVCLSIVEVLERNRTYQSTNPWCEPALGRRGLYRTAEHPDAETENLARLWVLNLSDGDHSLLDIAERSRLSFRVVQRVAEELHSHGLVTATSRVVR
jgi:aminopeptidase-like protein